MKKVLIVLLLLISIVCFASCEDNIDENHTHSFSKWTITIEASCIEEGTQTRTCPSCGYIEQSTLAKTGHTVVTDNAIPATCTENGKTEGKHCSVCNITIVNSTMITATGHQFDNGRITANASCTQKGIIEYSCTNTNCTYSYTENFSLPTYSATQINNQSLNYVGEIITYDKYGFEKGLATGFVYSSDGKIITNYHVIDEAYSAKITINGTSYNIVSVLAYDENIDLTVLKVNASGLTAANICTKPVQVGETVYAIGSSRGLTNTFSQGIITYADRVVSGVSHVQHDASITHGNSGGPLINQYGEVIGINTWGVAESQNLNFAVFTDELDNLVYGTPTTLADLYNLTHNAYNILAEYICAYGTYDADHQCYEIKFTDSSTDINNYYYDSYTLAYYTETSSIMLFNYYREDDWFVSTAFWFPPYSGELYYRASYELDNVGTNETSGYFNPATFTASTSTLPYNSFSGLQDGLTTLLNLYSSCIKDTLNWVSALLLTDNVGLTLADLGFISYVN